MSSRSTQIIGGANRERAYVDSANNALQVVTRGLDSATRAGLNLVDGVNAYNRFGLCLDADTGGVTDVWDGADDVTATKAWVPPAAGSETHNIVSGSASDTAAGTGARTIRIFGLTDWDTPEVSEDVTLNGTVDVTTANTYVVIFRMVVLTCGTGQINSGTITATARTSNTVTAAIKAGIGQTLMAVMAAPSGHSLTVSSIYASVEGTGAASLTGIFLVQENADVANSPYVTRTQSLFSNDSPWQETHNPPQVYRGPCIVKVRVVSGTNNTTVSASFEGYVVRDGL